MIHEKMSSSSDGKENYRSKAIDTTISSPKGRGMSEQYVDDNNNTNITKPSPLNAILKTPKSRGLGVSTMNTVLRDITNDELPVYGQGSSKKHATLSSTLRRPYGGDETLTSTAKKSKLATIVHTAIPSNINLAHNDAPDIEYMPPSEQKLNLKECLESIPIENDMSDLLCPTMVPKTTLSENDTKTINIDETVEIVQWNHEDDSPPPIPSLWIE